MSRSCLGTKREKKRPKKKGGGDGWTEALASRTPVMFHVRCQEGGRRVPADVLSRHQSFTAQEADAGLLKLGLRTRCGAVKESVSSQSWDRCHDQTARHRAMRHSNSWFRSYSLNIATGGGAGTR